MKKTKCDTCLGCDLVGTPGFKGREECEYYIRGNRISLWIPIVIVLTFIAIGLSIYGFYIWFSRLAGG